MYVQQNLFFCWSSFDIYNQVMNKRLVEINIAKVFVLSETPATWCRNPFHIRCVHVFQDTNLSCNQPKNSLNNVCMCLSVHRKIEYSSYIMMQSRVAVKLELMGVADVDRHKSGMSGSKLNGWYWQCNMVVFEHPIITLLAGSFSHSLAFI